MNSTKIVTYSTPYCFTLWAQFIVIVAAVLFRKYLSGGSLTVLFGMIFMACCHSAAQVPLSLVDLQNRANLAKKLAVQLG